MSAAPLILVLTFLAVALGRTIERQYLTNIQTENMQARASVSETVTYGQVTIGRDDKIVSWNKGMELFTGWSAEQMLGDDMSCMVGAGQDPEAIKRVGTIRPHAWIGKGGIDFKNKDGDSVTMDLSIRDTVVDGVVQCRDLYFDTPGVEKSIKNLLRSSPPVLVEKN